MARKILAVMAILILFLLASGKLGISDKDFMVKKKPISPTITVPTQIPAPTDAPLLVATQPISGQVINVNPENSDSIQAALDQAEPGDVIELQPGVYLQDFITKKSGQPSKPITVRGPKNAILKGAGAPRIIEIHHDYIVLDGFTVDGLYGASDSESGYRDKLIYIQGKSPGNGPQHVQITNMEVLNAGGECIRLRYFARENIISNNRISGCGSYDFKFGKGGKNGEGIYIGTAPEQLTDGKNPDSARDSSNGNHIYGNIINTRGNECVDIKEGSSGNLVEKNSCTGQRDPESGGMDSRGNNNIFRNNEIFDNLGAGIRFGGDEDEDGIDNQAYGNIIRGNSGGGIKFQRTPQGKVCGNRMEGNGDNNSVGSYREDFDPAASC